MITIVRSTFIAAVCRAECLALATFTDRQLLEVRQYRLITGERTTEHVSELISTLARDYGASCLVAEPGSLAEAAAAYTALRVQTLSLRAGKAWRFGAAVVLTQAKLFRQLIEQHPELRRFVNMVGDTGKVATAEPWHTTQLLAVALGLAYLATASAARSTLHSLL